MAETKKYLTMKERICFTVGAFGRSGIYTLMSMFTLVFFQNGAGLTLKQGTTIILIGRVFDALNDPVMGMIVDRTKSKWGKMRPYLLFAPIPIAITTIALFSAPFKEGSTAAFVWALVTYILWGVAFTVQDVPFWGLPTYNSIPTYKSAFADYESRQKVCLDDKQTFKAEKNDDYPYSLSKQYGLHKRLFLKRCYFCTFGLRSFNTHFLCI